MLEQVISNKVGWTRVAFGDVVRKVNDKVDPWESGLERYIAGDHMDTDDLRIRRWGLIGDDYLGPAFHMRFKPGHVLYGSRRTYLRKVALADFEGITANTTYVLESKDPTVLMPELLPFIMQTETFHAHSIARSKGSVNPYINFSDVACFEFLLPPIQEQARLLEPLVAARNLEERLLEAEDAAAKTYEAWIEHELEDQGWQDEVAIDLLERATVGIVVKPADLYVNGGSGVPALRSLNVGKNSLSWDDCVRISDAGHASHQKSALKAGDVVIVRSGRPGDAAVIPEIEHGLNAVDLIVSTPGPKLRPEFFSRFLNSVAGRKQFASGIAGTAQLHFNVALFKKLIIPVPSIDAQDEFIGRARKFEESTVSLRSRISAAQHLRRTILQDCVG